MQVCKRVIYDVSLTLRLFPRRTERSLGARLSIGGSLGMSLVIEEEPRYEAKNRGETWDEAI